MIVMDGCWKIRFSHCMWITEVTLPINVNYPNVCPEEQMKGQAFCKHHCEVAKKAGIHTEIRKFLNSCGVKSNPKGISV